MKAKNRIFLMTNGELRKFLWLQQGTDGSIYIGSATEFRYGTKGVILANKNDIYGTPLNINDGKTMGQKELAGKLSFHKSGIINLPTINVDKNDRLQIKAFSQFEGALPLFSVIPMLPTKYPLSEKTLNHNDLVIDCGLNQGKCIGIVLFVAFSEPKQNLFNALHEQGLSISFISANICNKKLCAMMYYNEHFLGWPKEEIKSISHPEKNGEMPWPVIIPSYVTT